ncbi:hypothetical protein [Rahnella selenatireducens]|uniref:hypothetical protein n=1 Tax=Rahnella selenatireducens TaxID=3389797 RepID=UPI0039691EFA
MKTAKEALDKGLAEKISPTESCLTEAFNILNRPENEHYNLFFAENCKEETSKLESLEKYM